MVRPVSGIFWFPLPKPYPLQAFNVSAQPYLLPFESSRAEHGCRSTPHAEPPSELAPTSTNPPGALTTSHGTSLSCQTAAPAINSPEQSPPPCPDHPRIELPSRSSSAQTDPRNGSPSICWSYPPPSSLAGVPPHTAPNAAPHCFRHRHLSGHPGVNRDHPQVALASLMLPHPFLADGKHPYHRNHRFPNAPLLQLATRDLGQQLEQVRGAICIAIDSNE